MTHKAAYNRKNYFIKKKFQTGFFVKFFAIIVVEAAAALGLFLYMSKGTLTTGYSGYELKVARTHVVGTEVAAHRLERVLLRDALHARSDDDAELGLVVAFRDDGRDDDRLARADERVRPLGEEEGLRGDLHALLLRVVAVVETDADDLPGALDRQHGANLLRRGEQRVDDPPGPVLPRPAAREVTKLLDEVCARVGAQRRRPLVAEEREGRSWPSSASDVWRR